VTDHDYIFLSYSRNDLEAADNLRLQLERQGLSVFKDDKSIREGDLWLSRLQEAVDACTGFVVLVGRDGVGRWIGAETQAALNRYFGPHDDAERLPIFPVLIGDAQPDALPAFLRLFQATPWNGIEPLPKILLDQIHTRTIVACEGAVFEGCPFVGLDAFRMDQARLFFGRQRETLDALACFDTRPGRPTVRWLEINGNSGSGKSSLINAGLLPLVEQGWLWPRTGFEHWQRIGPLMPGQHPMGMLAESLSRFSRHVLNEPLEMADVRRVLEADDRGLADWLRGRKRSDDTAFLLALDQFGELFTFADPDERKRFDRLLAAALADADCPLFLISTVRADFLDRFEDLPRLVHQRNRLGKAWTLPPIGEDALREVIAGPARLAGLERGAGGHGGGRPGGGRGLAAGGERPRLAVGKARGKSVQRAQVHGPGQACRHPQRQCRRSSSGPGRREARAGAGAAVQPGQGRPGGQPAHAPPHPARGSGGDRRRGRAGP